MTLPELIGRCLIVGLPGHNLTDELISHLRNLHVGGFIAFTRNFASPDQFRALVEAVRQAVGRPVLVFVDHEGGRIIRFHQGVTRFPSALEMGRRSLGDIDRQGQTEGEELRRLGVDVNLAPCVDVLVEGSNPVIGDRSYGREPHRVAACAVARIEGLRRAGVAACAKHFPGLGMVPKDPHRHLPTVSLDEATLRDTHWIPFAASVAVGVPAVMSSHVCYPQLEGVPGLPATFSATLIQQVLRKQLGFGGAVLTDDLEMGALRELLDRPPHGSRSSLAEGVVGRRAIARRHFLAEGVVAIGEAAVRALEAGHDGLLVCSNLQMQWAVAQAVLEACEQGRIGRAQLERSVDRLERLRLK